MQLCITRKEMSLLRQLTLWNNFNLKIELIKAFVALLWLILMDPICFRPRMKPWKCTASTLFPKMDWFGLCVRNRRKLEISEPISKWPRWIKYWKTCVKPPCMWLLRKHSLWFGIGILNRFGMGIAKRVSSSHLLLSIKQVLNLNLKPQLNLNILDLKMLLLSSTERKLKLKVISVKWTLLWANFRKKHILPNRLISNSLRNIKSEV